MLPCVVVAVREGQVMTAQGLREAELAVCEISTEINDVVYGT